MLSGSDAWDCSGTTRSAAAMALKLWIPCSGDQISFSAAAEGVGARGRELAEFGEYGEGGNAAEGWGMRKSRSWKTEERVSSGSNVEEQARGDLRGRRRSTKEVW